jgi:2-hydroxycyclohexanecarboxyl-CoA dehydrogenase
MADIAVVTGAASGIGRGVAVKLARDGFDIAALDIREANDTADEIAAMEGRRVLPLHCDVTDRKSVEAARWRIHEELGKPSVIVNCAGWSVIEPFLDNDEEFWDRALDINLRGTILVTRVFIDDLLANNGGRIVLIASDAGRVGSTGEVVYSAAKGGVIGFTKALAREMARKSITVNCVCPGPTATPMLLAQDEKRIDALTRAIPMRRLAQPADIAAAVAFFASDGAGYITGQILSVSGGLTMAG